MYVINRRALPSNRFQGSDHGPARISIILSESEFGTGPRLHRHPYDETWVIHEGRVQVWIGEETGEAGAGDIVVSPSNTPHKFTSIGQEIARLTCIHASPHVVTELLD
jgi:mannose-6-phosphate isomerase-like protein (cupin superfamily)